MLQEPWKVLTKMYAIVQLAQRWSRSCVAHVAPHAPNSHTTAALPLPEDASRPRIDFLVFFVDMTNAKSLSNLKTRLLKVDKDYFAQGRSCIVATRGTTIPHHLAFLPCIVVIIRGSVSLTLTVLLVRLALVDLNRSHAFTTEHLEAVTNVYGMPVFYCNLTVPLHCLSVHVSSSSWYPYLRSDHLVNGGHTCEQKREQLQNLSVRVYKAAELANGFIPYISPLIFAP
jgi:hypothetical protein